MYRSNATYAAAVLADSPVSYWRLGETTGTNAADSKGSNAGTYTAGYTLAQNGATADGNKAVALNGSTGYVTVPDHATLRITGDLTLEAWVNPTDRSSFFMIVTKGTGVNATWEWRLETTTGLPNLLIAGAGAVVGASAPATGVWSHVAVTISGNTAQHYLNGATNGSTGNAAGRVDSGTAVLLGARAPAAPEFFFKGSLDEVAAYSTPLSAARVLAHYTAA